MNARFKVNMLEATRLTRAGRLEEAMAVLRGALAGGVAAASSDVADDARQAQPAPRPTILDFTPPPISTDGIWTLPQSNPASAESAAGEGRPLIRQGLRGLLDRLGQLVPARGPDGLTVPTRAPTPLPEGARFEERLYANGAGSRAYKLYIPSGYAGQALPLVVMLHGCTQSPDDFAAGTRMNVLAEEETFLVAYPAQAQSANASKCWNWFSEGDQKRDRGEPSLIAGITREVMREFPVAPDRVYIAGLSAGGAAAAILGATYPDLYAAIGVHSGLACGAARDMPSAFAAMRQGASAAVAGAAIPTIVFHGDRDMTVNAVNGDQIIARSRIAADLRVSVSGGKAPGGMSYTRTVHAEASGRALLEQWVLHDAGHAWSGGSAAGSYTDPRGPDASREMLRFFLQHEASGAPLS